MCDLGLQKPFKFPSANTFSPPPFYRRVIVELNSATLPMDKRWSDTRSVEKEEYLYWVVSQLLTISSRSQYRKYVGVFLHLRLYRTVLLVFGVSTGVSGQDVFSKPSKLIGQLMKISPLCYSNQTNRRSDPVQGLSLKNLFRSVLAPIWLLAWTLVGLTSLPYCTPILWFSQSFYDSYPMYESESSKVSRHYLTSWI